MNIGAGAISRRQQRDYRENVQIRELSFRMSDLTVCSPFLIQRARDNLCLLSWRILMKINHPMNRMSATVIVTNVYSTRIYRLCSTFQRASFSGVGLLNEAANALAWLGESCGIPAKSVKTSPISIADRTAINKIPKRRFIERLSKGGYGLLTRY